MALRFDWAVAGSKATLVARSLGFVFLVYFIPALLRDLPAAALGGGGLLELLAGTASRPAMIFALVAVSLLLSIGFVLLYGRTSLEARDPRLLLSFNTASLARWVQGFGAGAVIIILAHGVLVAAGVLRIEGISRTILERPLIAAAIVMTLFAEALREELAFRGPSQRDLSRVIGFPLAAVFFSASFTVLHLANPNAEAAGLLGVFLAGLALAGIVRVEGDLSLAAGLHAGWNVALGMIVSVPVSGILIGTRLLDTKLEGGRLATGGGFGFESSAVGIATLFLAGWAAWRWKGRT